MEAALLMTVAEIKLATVRVLQPLASRMKRSYDRRLPETLD